MVDRIIRERPPELKTSTMVEGDFQKFVEAIRHGDIAKVLAKANIPKAEITKFFANQWSELHRNILMDGDPIVATSGSAPDPSDPMVIGSFMQQDTGNSLTKDDEGVLHQEVVKSALSVGKAQSIGGVAKATSSGEGAMTSTEVEDQANETLDEFDSFMNDLWSTVLDQQMMREYEAKMDELQKEVDRLISLVKSGKIGVEYVLLALAKVNATKNGVLFAWQGKKANMINDAMNEVSDSLTNLDTSDPNFSLTVQQVQSETRSLNYDMNTCSTNMQQITSNVTTTMESVQNMMQQIFKTRQELISKQAAATR